MLRALLSALSRNKTGPLLVAAQVALTFAVLVNVAYLVEQRFVEIGKPSGLDLDNMFWIATGALTSKDYDYATSVKADLDYLNALPGVVAASTVNNLPQTGSISGLPFAASLEALEHPNGGVDGEVYIGYREIPGCLGSEAGRWTQFRCVSREAAGGRFQRVARRLGARGNHYAGNGGKLFPDGNAVGKTIFVGLINKSSTVVGVVDHMMGQPASGEFEKFVTQIVIVPIIANGPNGLYVVRTQPNQRAGVMRQVEKEFADLRAGRFVSRLDDFTRTADAVRQETRASAVILAVVALFVLAVTVVGISGLAAFM